MEAAIEEAKKGLREGGIPIGSALVKDGKIIGRGRNRRVQENDPILHAEIDCLCNAGRIGSYSLALSPGSPRSKKPPPPSASSHPHRLSTPLITRRFGAITLL